MCEVVTFAEEQMRVMSEQPPIAPAAISHGAEGQHDSLNRKLSEQVLDKPAQADPTTTMEVTSGKRADNMLDAGGAGDARSNVSCEESSTISKEGDQPAAGVDPAKDAAEDAEEGAEKGTEEGAERVEGPNDAMAMVPTTRGH